MPIVTPDQVEHKLQQAERTILRLKAVRGPDRRPIRALQDASEVLADLAVCVRDLNKRLRAIERAAR